MGEIFFELVVVALLISLNGLFALAEMAVVTVKRLRIEEAAAGGDRRASMVLSLLDSPTTFLSTVQVGITIVGIAAGVFGGATLSKKLGSVLDQVTWIEPFGNAAAFIAVVGAITVLSVIFGELIPKRVALAYPEVIAITLGPLLIGLSKLASPLVWLLDSSSSAVVASFGLRHPDVNSTITEADIRSIVEQGSEEGVIEETEGEIVSKVFRLGDRTAGSLMTPRVDLAWLDLEKPIRANWDIALASPHSFFPVARGSIDSVIGVIAFKDLASTMMTSAEFLPDTLVRDPLRIPTNVNALKILEIFRESKQHIALVFDEHGSLDGIITPHDVFEAMVGSMSVEEEKEWVRRADGSLLADAAIDLVDLFELLELDESEKDVAPGYHSLGGLIFHQLGHIPKAGEFCDFAGFRLEVLDMDGVRIDKVLISPISDKRKADAAEAVENETQL